MTEFHVRGAVPADLDAIVAIQAITFPDYQEDRAVFAERMVLYPDGFFVVMLRGDVRGYLVSYPWRRADPPPINSLLGERVANADAYYVHDLSLLPDIRGTGASGLLIAAMKAHAADAGFSTMMLTAVGGASVFWERHGFRAVHIAELVARLSGYGPQAVYMEHQLER